MGATAGSTRKWSKQFNEMRNLQGTQPKVSSFEITVTILKSLLQQFSAPLVASKYNDRGTKRRVMTASFCLLCRTSASVDTLPAPEKLRKLSAGPGKEQNKTNGP